MGFYASIFISINCPQPPSSIKPVISSKIYNLVQFCDKTNVMKYGIVFSAWQSFILKYKLQK